MLAFTPTDIGVEVVKSRILAEGSLIGILADIDVVVDVVLDDPGHLKRRPIARGIADLILLIDLYGVPHVQP